MSVPLSASEVTLEMTVNDSTDPVMVTVGQTVNVKIYGTVTDNLYNGTTSLGLAGYALNVLSTSAALVPEPHLHPITLVPDGQWKVTFAVPQLTIQARGNIGSAGQEQNVYGHGAGLSDFNNFDIAVTRTLLAQGSFLAIAPGSLTLGLGNDSGLAANVIAFNGSVFSAVPATTIILGGGASITVTPVPEPAAAGLVGAGLLGLLLRRRKMEPRH
ncbi:MAG: PEP-CTERM sorting domain-containing protein [Phycisphaeraceae bacterium]